MKLGINSVLFGGHDLQTAFHYAQLCGYDGIELSAIDGISIDPSTVQTNIVIFDISGTGKTSSDICSQLKDAGILAIGISDAQIRMVTHLDVGKPEIDFAIDSLMQILTAAKRSSDNSQT